MAEQKKYLDPDIVSKFSHFTFLPRGAVEGTVAGLHRSPYKGFSVEFSEHRAYTWGDEIKHIDWKVFGRTDRFYIKQYEEETNLKAYILLDTSASMGYSSNGITKLEYASHIAAILSYIFIKQQDAVGLVPFSSSIARMIPPRSTPGHLQIILNALAELKPEGKSAIASPCHELANIIKRRALIVIISDLLDKEEEVLQAIKHFRHNKHECVIFHTLDRTELDFSFNESLTLKDVETDEKIFLHAPSLRDEYCKRVSQFIEWYKKICSESQIDYVLVDTSIPYDRVMASYLTGKERK